MSNHRPREMVAGFGNKVTEFGLSDGREEFFKSQIANETFEKLENHRRNAEDAEKNILFLSVFSSAFSAPRR